MILGIFDSGLGGLTVLKEILKDNCYEKIIYYGDTKRLPYGNKSKEELYVYAKEDIEFLRSKGADEIVVACGTISSNVLDNIKNNYDFKLVGIIDAACKKAKEVTLNNKIGIIATPATISTHVFKNKLKDYQAFEIPCEKFTPLIEKGDIDNKEVDEAINEYLKPLKENNIDTLILGCTHYPILSEKIKKYFDGKINLVNSGEVLNKELNKGEKIKPTLEFYVSGDTKEFTIKAKKLFDIIKLENVKNK